MIASEILRSSYCYISDVEIYRVSREASTIINGIRVYRLATAIVQIGSFRNFYLPPDGRWIEEAFLKKLNRYAPEVVRSHILVIDGQYHLDSEQMNAFCKMLAERDLLFAEIWTVTMGTAYRLR